MRKNGQNYVTTVYWGANWITQNSKTNVEFSEELKLYY